MDREAPLKVYGSKDNEGPIFERLCPKCGRFMRFPETIKWRENMHGLCEFQKIECSRCGPVDPAHVGWSGDYD
jgi:ribosomal protein S27AE